MRTSVRAIAGIPRSHHPNPPNYPHARAPRGKANKVPIWRWSKTSSVHPLHFHPINTNLRLPRFRLVATSTPPTRPLAANGWQQKVELHPMSKYGTATYMRSAPFPRMLDHHHHPELIQRGLSRTPRSSQAIFRGWVPTIEPSFQDTLLLQPLRNAMLRGLAMSLGHSMYATDAPLPES